MCGQTASGAHAVRAGCAQVTQRQCAGAAHALSERCAGEAHRRWAADLGGVVHTTAVVVVVVVAKVVTEGGLVGVAGVVVGSFVAVGVDDRDGDDTGAQGSLHKYADDVSPIYL